MLVRLLLAAVALASSVSFSMVRAADPTAALYTLATTSACAHVNDVTLDPSGSRIYAACEDGVVSIDLTTRNVTALTASYSCLIPSTVVAPTKDSPLLVASCLGGATFVDPTTPNQGTTTTYKFDPCGNGFAKWVAREEGGFFVACYTSPGLSIWSLNVTAPGASTLLFNHSDVQTGTDHGAFSVAEKQHRIYFSDTPLLPGGGFGDTKLAYISSNVHSLQEAQFVPLPPLTFTSELAIAYDPFSGNLFVSFLAQGLYSYDTNGWSVVLADSDCRADMISPQQSGDIYVGCNTVTRTNALYAIQSGTLRNQLIVTSSQCPQPTGATTDADGRVIIACYSDSGAAIVSAPKPTYSNNNGPNGPSSSTGNSYQGTPGQYFQGNLYASSDASCSGTPYGFAETVDTCVLTTTKPVNQTNALSLFMEVHCDSNGNAKTTLYTGSGCGKTYAVGATSGSGCVALNVLVNGAQSSSVVAYAQMTCSSGDMVHSLSLAVVAILAAIVRTIQQM